MRIIGGTYRGKKLRSPQNSLTRPTADRIREAIFNILENRFHLSWSSLKILDAFAGTGALGLEAFSRGAKAIFFMEKNPTALKILKENMKSLGESFPTYGIDILHCQIQAPGSMDLIFMDPPYHQNLILGSLQTLHGKGWVAEKTLLVLEMAEEERSFCKFFASDDPMLSLGEMPMIQILHEKKYGKTRIIFGYYQV